MKILFVCKRRLDVEEKKTYGLETSASFVVNFLRESGVDVDIGRAFDANDIDRLVTQSDPTHVVLEALWATPDKVREILSIKRHKARKWIIRIHCRTAFLANEGIAFPWILGYREKIYPVANNLWIAPNSLDTTKDLREAFGIKTVYLPNIYCPQKYELPPRVEEKDVLNVGLFGAIRPMKNHLLQALAVVKYANRVGIKAKVHINGTRLEQRGENCLKNLEAFFQGQNGIHELIKHDWMTHEEFSGLCSQMDIGLQVSFSETFNIVCADLIYNGVPCIGSLPIDWLPNKWQVVNPNDSEEIFQRMSQALSVFGGLTLWNARRSLNSWSHKAGRIWLNFLNA